MCQVSLILHVQAGQKKIKRKTYVRPKSDNELLLTSGENNNIQPIVIFQTASQLQENTVDCRWKNSVFDLGCILCVQSRYISFKISYSSIYFDIHSVTFSQDMNILRYVPIYTSKYILWHLVKCYFPNGDPMRTDPMMLPVSCVGGFPACKW